MKKLGLIGGIGPESTILYYHDIVYGVQQRVGKSFFPNLNIESLSVFEVLRMCAENDYISLENYILRGINNLATGGADFVAMTGNTPHIIFDELKSNSPVPIVSIVEATCNEVKKKGFTKIGLLGTEVTMNGDFFRKPFINAGISVIVPNEKEKSFIGGKISDELELGIVRGETISAFLDIINKMINEEKIEAIILGCTELPLLFKGVQLSVPCLDTMQIHIQELIEMILED
ncbi:aspartate racemase [Clostridium sp. MF28]|uniref:aspartate/glutamate racemase family protein n=1 Tax=Clostridium TaxID=1485 RepID=UPI000CF9F882|nr:MULTISPECIES: amino acid racemase [Clostridium]AVK49346.1 aspartate racemase [Clostridium sp. MF28]PSM58040.1 aspartate racemase [Clostridium diolis]